MFCCWRMKAIEIGDDLGGFTAMCQDRLQQVCGATVV